MEKVTVLEDAEGLQQDLDGVGKMRNAESKMRNGPCGKVPRNGV